MTHVSSPADDRHTLSASELQSALTTAYRTLELGKQGIETVENALRNGLSETFGQAVAALKGCQGRVIVSGMGKSGHVGQKIAATLASTGSPASFVHPAEASHGDLGMITPQDVILALSWSGETAELANLIAYSRRFSVPLVALTSKADSALGIAADVALILPQVTEACPHGLAPTTSTLVQLAVGDCLAMALLDARGFTALDFKVFHPGGQLGANLKHVGDIMHTGARLPLARADAPMSAVLVIMSEKSFGCVGIVNDEGELAGIITDGDLRRHMAPGLLDKHAGDVMTRSPKTVGPQLLASAALHIMNVPPGITALFVVEQKRPVGIIHVHDLLRIGVA